jgi:two-component system NtrC family response regulator
MVYPIETHALRNIREDIPVLAQYFCEIRRRNHTTVVSAEAMKLLVRYDWPGNMRELHNAIERALIPERPGPILPEHLPNYVLNPPETKTKRTSLKASVDEAKKKRIEACLKKNGYNVAATARELGITPRHLWRDIRRLGIQLP